MVLLSYWKGDSNVNSDVCVVVFRGFSWIIFMCGFFIKEEIYRRLYDLVFFLVMGV